MKLMRVGPLGQEKPAILDKDGKVRDLSGHVADIGGLQHREGRGAQRMVHRTHALDGAHRARTKARAGAVGDAEIHRHADDRDIEAAEAGHDPSRMPRLVATGNRFLPGDLEAQIEAFVEHYNHQRYHEALSNVTPADAYFGRAASILNQRERIKRHTIEHRRLQHRKLAA